MDVNYLEFNNVSDYPQNSNTKILNISRNDLKRYAVSTGGFSNFYPSLNGIKFYESIIDMALSSGNNSYQAGISYSGAETSIKSTISFFLGMISAGTIWLVRLTLVRSTRKNTSKRSGSGSKMVYTTKYITKKGEEKWLLRLI